MARAEADSAADPGAGASDLEFSFSIQPIAAILAGGLVLRLLLATLPGFGIDIGSFQAWSMQLQDRGPWNFYDPNSFSDYTPGYLYGLWIIGWLNELFGFSGGTFEYVLKLPAIAADVASAYLLYRMLDGQSQQARLGAAALYLLLPAALLIGPVWGQVDSVLAFFLMLTVYYLGRGRPVRGALAYTVAFLVKPQAIAAFPFLAFWMIKNNDIAVTIRAGAISAVAGTVMILPFFFPNPFDIVGSLRDAADVYPYDTFWAYNLWGTFGIGVFGSDSVEYLGITHRAWGFALFGLATASTMLVFARSRDQGMLALGTALSILAFYLFLTRMHERYLFPFFLPFLAAAVMTRSRVLWAAFLGLSVIQFLNLFVVYTFPLYNENNTPLEWLSSWIESGSFPLNSLALVDTDVLLSVLATLSFPLLLFKAYLLTRREEEASEPA